MKTVTAVKRQKSQRDRVSVFLDDKYGFALSLEVAHQFGIHKGQQLTKQEISTINEIELLHKATNSALRYMSYRPRSISEVRTRLRQQKYGPAIIEKVIDKLKGRQILDDLQFAEFWADSRRFSSPRSRRMIKLELRRKGVSDEIVEVATGDIDDEAGAYKAALKKANTLKNTEFDQFIKKMFNFLHNRGFSYGIIRPTIEKVWAEIGNKKAADI